MYIEGQCFKTDLADVNDVRRLLMTTLYSRSDCIDYLTMLIRDYLEVINCEYDPNTFTFTIRIKKTAMRRVSGFKQDPTFYYQIAPKIYREFLEFYEYDIIKSLENAGVENASEKLERIIYHDSSIMANLCNVSCIADNLVLFKL